MRKRFAAVVLSATIASSGLILAAPAAQASGCVTKNEYGRVKMGFRKKRVHNIFETGGKQTSQYVIGGTFYQDREYKTCISKWGFVSIGFKNGKVDSKYAYWG